MKRYLQITLLIAVMMAIPLLTYSDETAKQKAIDLVNEGIAYIEKVGQENAFKAFSNREGDFVEDAYYLFVVDFTGLTLAHGGNNNLIGKSMYDLKDADSNYFIREFIKVAKTKGSGVVNYKWSNPTTKKIEPKSSYIKRVDGNDFFVGCGIYLKQ